jgi:anti-anti-sigma factor
MSATASETRDGVLVVEFLDAELSDEIRNREIGEELVRLIDREAPKQLLIDFDGVSFMSSSMLGQLAMLTRRCQRDEISLKWCNVAEAIREVLNIVRLDTLATVVADEEEAFAAFAGERAARAEALGEVVTPADQWDRCREAAQHGDPAAQYHLGTCFENGTGVGQDFSEALAWYRRAAEQGHAQAQHALATAYAFGMHVPQDYDEAIKWYRRAAEQGWADAQYAMGMNCTYGIGVAEDAFEAETWYRKAARQGHAKAQEALDQMKAS